MKIIERNVQEIGKSLLVTLPKDWTRLLKVRKGSRIKMMISDQGNLSIAPEFVKKEEKKDVVIHFDENFNRRFIREYFYGNEKITVLFDKKISEAEKKEMYSFLKKFINVQIIEEKESKVEVKCFKIEELSMEECLKRMYYISTNMIDEALSDNNRIKLKEMRDTLTRFYYLLVMQVRRFLSEGTYVKENQIPLIRALDIRMVAEKIQRIGGLAHSFNKLDRTELIKSLKDAKEFYSEAFGYFISLNYEKALTMWHREVDKQKKFDKIKAFSFKHKDVILYRNIAKISYILRYAKEISMLVR